MKKDCFLHLLGVPALILLLLLSGCGGGETFNTNEGDTPAGTDAEVTENRLLAGSLSDVLLTTEIPEALYEITAQTIGSAVPEEEQRQVVQVLAEVFDYEPLLDEGDKVDSNGKFWYPTTDGGQVCYLDKVFDYIGANNYAMSDDASQIRAITVAEDADLMESYPLGGKDYTIGEAVSYIESLWANTMYQYAQYDDIQVWKVLVYEHTDGNYSYVLLVDVMYEGLPVEQYSTITQASGYESGGFRPSFIIVEMDAPDHICLYADYYPSQLVSKELLTSDILTADEAVTRADKVLAEYTDFQIQEMKLCYAAQWNTSDSETADNFVYAPYWCIVLEWGENEAPYVNCLPNVSLFIDAQTGTAYLVDSNDYTELAIYE